MRFSDQELLDEIFCSNLQCTDKYLELARRLGLKKYLELYENI